jgi:hypothetical protein
VKPTANESAEHAAPLPSNAVPSAKSSASQMARFAAW